MGVFEELLLDKGKSESSEILFEDILDVLEIFSKILLSLLEMLASEIKLCLKFIGIL